MRWATLVAAVGAGFLGGLVSPLLWRAPSRADARDGQDTVQVVRAERFELVNDKGEILGEWASDGKPNPHLRMWLEQKDKKDAYKNLAIDLGAYQNGPAVGLYYKDRCRIYLQAGIDFDTREDFTGIGVLDDKGKTVWKAK